MSTYIEVPFCKPAKEAHQHVEDFEAAFAPIAGTEHVVATNSGYTALELALRAMGCAPGMEVIMPAFTMVATAHAVRATGAVPVFVDVGYDGCIDVAALAGAINKRTWGIIPVHMYGYMADMPAIMLLAKTYGLYVLEDAAEAHGATLQGKPAGSWGTAAAFSFYSNKIVSAGEGGAVCTNDLNIAEAVRSMRSYAFGQGYAHRGMGWSYRMNPYGAAMGLYGCTTIADTIAKKRHIAGIYRSRIRGVQHPPTAPGAVHWQYWVRHPDRNGLREHLANHGIETRETFKPMHMQPMYKAKHHKRGPLYVSEELYNTGLLLPTMHTLQESEARYISKVVNSYTR